MLLMIIIFMINSLQAECGDAIMANSWQFLLKDEKHKRKRPTEVGQSRWL